MGVAGAGEGLGTSHAQGVQVAADAVLMAWGSGRFGTCVCGGRLAWVSGV